MTRDDLIYTNVTNAVKTAYPSVYRSAKYELKAEKYPAIYVVKVASNRTYEGTDLNFSDDQHRVTYQVDVYTSGAKAMSIAEGIMEVAENAFSQMFFRMSSCAPMSNIDPSIYRMTARFDRIICGNELKPRTRSQQ